MKTIETWCIFHSLPPQPGRCLLKQAGNKGRQASSRGTAVKAVSPYVGPRGRGISSLFLYRGGSAPLRDGRLLAVLCADGGCHLPVGSAGTHRVSRLRDAVCQSRVPSVTRCPDQLPGRAGQDPLPGAEKAPETVGKSSVLGGHEKLPSKKTV